MLSADEGARNGFKRIRRSMGLEKVLLLSRRLVKCFPDSLSPSRWAEVQNMES